MKLQNLHGEQSSITDALQLRLPEHAVISVTGAGGKTSLIFAWAGELALAGKKVAVTTTTHMYEPSSVPAGVTFAAVPDPERPGKVMSPSQDDLDALFGSKDVTLIEADGSRRMPLKWPAPWEPVVPERTDITVYVAGLSAVGKRTGDMVYRADDLPERLKRETVDVNLLHKIISSSEGGRKGTRGDFRVFLNQVDDDMDRLAAAYRLQQILSVMGIQTAWGSLLTEGELAACAGHGSGEDRKTEPNDLPGHHIKIAVILEAAGNSTRFGSNKLLHIMEDGRPMAACIMDAVCEAEKALTSPHADCNVKFRKILVTQYDEVAALAPDFEIVMNDRPDLGISRSMQLGIEAAGDTDAYMFCVCDQPGLKASTLVRLMDAYTHSSHDPAKKETAGIVSLAWQGEMCSPKIFSSKYRDELMSLSGDTGGRQIIAAHRDELLLVEASDEAEVSDIDRL